MSLPPAAPTRQLKHRRPIDAPVFARGGGLWAVDASVHAAETRAMPCPERGDAAGGDRPFQFDRCHMLRTGGLAVRQLGPRGYRPAAASDS